MLFCICACRLVCIGVGKQVSMEACKPACRAVCVLACTAFCRALSKLDCICAWRLFCKLLCMAAGVEGAAWDMGWSNRGCMWLEFWGWFWAGSGVPEELSSWGESGRKTKSKRQNRSSRMRDIDAGKMPGRTRTCTSEDVRPSLSYHSGCWTQTGWPVLAEPHFQPHLSGKADLMAADQGWRPRPRPPAPQRWSCQRLRAGC